MVHCTKLERPPVSGQLSHGEASASRCRHRLAHATPHYPSTLCLFLSIDCEHAGVIESVTMHASLTARYTLPPRALHGGCSACVTREHHVATLWPATWAPADFPRVFKARGVVALLC
jgi:hypothetical protein